MRGCGHCRLNRLYTVVFLLLTVTTTLTIWILYGYLQQRLHPGQQYMSFVWKAERKDLENPIIHKHKFLYLLNNKTICQKEGGVFLLIYVLSSRKNKVSREIIRKTWGSVRVFRGKHVRVVFLTGHKHDGYELSLKRQSSQYGDIIEGSFVDSYENLTYKSVMGLHWVNNFCNNTRFVLKTDDDVVVNIYKILHFLIEIDNDPTKNTGFLYCNVEGGRQGAVPIRRNNSKFYVKTTDYKYDLYPPYCHGPGYVFSVDVAVKLLNSTKLVPYFKFEDVFMGFCIKTAGIVPQNNFFGFYIDIASNSWKRFHWTILKHLGNEFKTNATQFEDTSDQKSISHYRSFFSFIIIAMVFMGFICVLLAMWLVPWFCKTIFLFSQYAIPISLSRIRSLYELCIRTSRNINGQK